MNTDRPLVDLLNHGFVPGAERIVDRFGRTFTYLRVSITDLCNLRCVYCMPEEGMTWLPKDQILSYEEILTVVQAAAACGVYKVRITGGEPLARRDVAELVRMLAGVPGITDLAMTTNGVLLGEQAHDLAAAGLKRINISLDTLDRAKFRAIARRDGLDAVLDGIAAAENAELAPIKLNMVVLGGLNDDEVEAFAEMSLERPIDVRFIEYMPLEEAKGCAMGSGKFDFVGNDVTRAKLTARFGELEPLEVGAGAKSPADVWRLPGACGRVGFISAMSAPFCERCDRLRLSATGEIRSCLLDGGGVDVKQMLRSGGSREAVIARFREAADIKPEVHLAWKDIPSANMSRIGG